MYLTAPLALGGLKIDRPLAGGFLGLTALSGLRVVETAVAAVYSRLTAEKTNNRASPVEMHPFCLRHLPRRGRSALRFLVESCGTMLSTHSPTSEAGGKVVASATKGGRRRQAAYKMAPQGTVPPQSVSRLKGRPLIGQARGQLRLTCVSHAGYAQSGTI